MLDDCCLYSEGKDDCRMEDVVVMAMNDDKTLLLPPPGTASAIPDTVVSASEDGSESSGLLSSSIDEFLVDDVEEKRLSSVKEMNSDRPARRISPTKEPSKTKVPTKQLSPSDSKKKNDTAGKPKRKKAPVVITKNYPRRDEYYQHLARLLSRINQTRQSRHCLFIPTPQTMALGRRGNISAVLYHIDHSTRQLVKAQLHPGYVQEQAGARKMGSAEGCPSQQYRCRPLWQQVHELLARQENLPSHYEYRLHILVK